ncbi:MAG: hypothetical protein RBT76_14740 [candidate division Zixibacteria bacterium]|nr:hypothetical protein [candidate division Zixibacteria bacterium]
MPAGCCDINNTSMRIESAFQKGQYLPELSFGTHLFHDLVEASIRYLPPYPDDPDIGFNRSFLCGDEKQPARIGPQFAGACEVLHVIDVPHVTGGLPLTVSMNADRQPAVGYLSGPATSW